VLPRSGLVQSARIIVSRALWPSGTPRTVVARPGVRTSGHAPRSVATNGERVARPLVGLMEARV
jgi:hypothetical protein